MNIISAHAVMNHTFPLRPMNVLFSSSSFVTMTQISSARSAGSTAVDLSRRSGVRCAIRDGDFYENDRPRPAIGVFRTVDRDAVDRATPSIAIASIAIAPPAIDRASTPASTAIHAAIHPSVGATIRTARVAHGDDDGDDDDDDWRRRRRRRRRETARRGTVASVGTR